MKNSLQDWGPWQLAYVFEDTTSHSIHNQTSEESDSVIKLHSKEINIV